MMKRILLPFLLLFVTILKVTAQSGPNMVIPTNGATNQPINISIYVSVVTGATTYTIEVDTLATFSASTIIKSGSRIQTFNGLKYGKTYYVRAKTNLTGYGSTRSFSTTTPTTSTNSPVSGSTCINKNAAIYCTAITNATTYYWEFNTAADFSGTSINKTSTSNYTIPGASFADLTLYYVRVRAYISSESLLTNYGAVTNYSFTASSTPITSIRLSAAASSPSSRTYKVNVVNTGSTYTWSVTGGTIVSGQGTGTIVTTGGETAVSVTESNSCGRNVTLTSASNQVLSSVWAPLTGTTGYRNQFKVWFAPVPGVNTPSAYRLQVSTSPTFTTLTYDVVGNASQVVSGKTYTNYNSVILQYNTCYYMRVSVNNGSYGNVTTICIGNPVTFLVDPVNNATGVKTKSYLSSGVVTNATAYSLELDTVNTFNSGAKKVISSTTHSFYVNNLLFSKKYYARVRATVGGVVQAYGTVTSFVTEGLPSTYLTSPVNGSTTYPITAYYYCYDAGNVSSYNWEFNTASDFTGTSITKTTTTNSVYVGDALQPSTIYFVRVKANQAGQGLSGSWGDVKYFTTPSAGARMADESFAEAVTSVDQFAVYPNPATTVITLDYVEASSAGSVKLELVDLQGKTVYVQTVNAEVGLNTFSFNIVGINSGVYMVRVSGDDSVLYSRLVVQ